MRAAVASLLVAALPSISAPEERARDPAARSPGPLQVSTSNPRYFADASGDPVYLTGSHVWWTLPRAASRSAVACPSRPWVGFDVRAYLDRMAALGHNFLRLWTWESTLWQQCGVFSAVRPHPWARAGPGRALDGRPKFDLRRLNRAYFDRLRTIVALARARGIYVSVMLFEGWVLQHGRPWHWRAHPFHGANNVNRVRADTNRDGYGTEIHTLRVPRVTRIQERYVARVLETLAGFDNALIEIANESGHYSTDWQYHFIRYVKAYQARRNLPRLPVGMSFQHVGGDNATLHASPADWIAPYGPEYMSDPPPTSGAKVVISDSDHHCGDTCKDFSFAWRSFLRGHNPIYMDPWDADAEREMVRRALGATRRLADRLDLSVLTPRNALSSTGYCLCDPGRTYVVYLPGPGYVGVDLSPGGSFAGEWIDPVSGETHAHATVAGGAWSWLTPPWGGPAVLLLRRTDG